jgi:hypothetical protein
MQLDDEQADLWGHSLTPSHTRPTGNRRSPLSLVLEGEGTGVREQGPLVASFAPVRGKITSQRD